MAWQQHRKVFAGAISTGLGEQELDTEITVETSKDSGLKYTADIYDLKPQTWKDVKEGDDCKIVLGWKDNGSLRRSVCLGTVKKKRRMSGKKGEKDTDVKYRLSGTDKSDIAVKARREGWWKNVSPSSIVRDIVGVINLDIGEITQMSGTTNGIWAMNKDKPVKFWLKKLMQLAQKITGEPWEWFTDAGKLYFVKKNSRETGNAPVLSYDTVLRYIGPSEGKQDEKSGKGLDFTAYIDPRISRSSRVVVEGTDGHDGAYKVVNYTYTSSTISGDHKIEGTLAPVDGDYYIRDRHDDLSESLASEDASIRGAARAVQQQRNGV